VITISDLRIAMVAVSRVKAGSLIITAGRLHLVGGRISSSTMLIGSFIVDIRSDLHPVSSRRLSSCRHLPHSTLHGSDQSTAGQPRTNQCWSRTTSPDDTRIRASWFICESCMDVPRPACCSPCMDRFPMSHMLSLSLIISSKLIILLVC
jgi:hypothetical protein